MKKLNDVECLNLWIAMVRRDKSSQYTYNERQGHIDALMEMFLQNEVDEDSARMLKRKVVETLVSFEGMKGKGKHSGWKENTEKDYEDAIQLNYVMPHAKTSGFKRVKTAQGYDPNIMAWLKKNYGPDVREDFIVAAHQPMHYLWLKFISEHFNRPF